MNPNNENDLVNCVKTFMKDDQDFVKLYIVESLVVLGQVLNPQVNSLTFSSFDFSKKHSTYVVVYVKALAEDPSWRIRYTIADKIFELGSALGKSTTRSLLLPYYVKFLQDNEPEVNSL